MEWSVCEGVVQNYGSLALSSGESSELAAVLRAATEGKGLQSILNDFCLCGHVAIKSDETAAIGMVHRLGLGKVRHLAVADLWIQHHVRSGKIRVSKMSGLENPSDAQTKYLGPEPLLRHTKPCNWVPVGVESSKGKPEAEASDKSGQGSRDEWTKSRIGPKSRKRTACSRRGVFSYS